MLKLFRKWWNGKLVTYEGDPFIIGFDRHWTSRLAHWLINFILIPEQRARLLAVIGILSFIFMLAKFFSDTDVHQSHSNHGKETEITDTLKEVKQSKN
ncbi:hypothetical protein Q5X53_08745 [Acinetobacter baumannii]|nr:hypothetical protein [Acinetobacter baumannii]